MPAFVRAYWLIFNCWRLTSKGHSNSADKKSDLQMMEWYNYERISQGLCRGINIED